MSVRSITVNLPEALYMRVRETAATSSLSLEQVLTQFIALSLPELENDIPREQRSELTAMRLLSDTELRNIANSKMNEKQQNRLESLAELKKHRTLTDSEQSTLIHLMEKTQWLMLRKAESYRLLARRGYKVFTSTISQSE